MDFVEDEEISFAIGEAVYAYQNRGLAILYEAKVLKIKEDVDSSTQLKKFLYYIHYKGWNDRYDEWVQKSAILKKTPETKLLFETTNNEEITKSSKSKEKKQNQSDIKKRKREDSAEYDSLPVKITIMSTLKKILVNDWDLVTQNRDLVPLPRTPSVENIIQDFVDSQNPILDQPTIDLINEMKDCFDMSLGAFLLYRFERLQLKKILKNYPANTKMSTIYGAEHLLRFFVKFPQFLSASKTDEETIEKSKLVAFKIMDYMNNNQTKIFLTQYEPASREYLKEIGYIVHDTNKIK